MATRIKVVRYQKATVTKWEKMVDQGLESKEKWLAMRKSVQDKLCFLDKNVDDLLKDDGEATKDEDVEECLKQTDEIKDKLFYISSLVDEAILKFSDLVPNRSYFAPTSKCVNLPKLQMPIFSGNIMEFRNFWNMFSANIDNNEGISKCAQFSYLVSLLRGEALASINGIEICDKNYDFAKKIVPADFLSLKQLVDVISMHIYSLDSLDVSVENHNIYYYIAKIT